VTTPEPIVAPEELLADPTSRTLLDVRWQLGRTDGRERFEAGHIPGAVLVDLETALADPPGERGRHPLPDPARFGEEMRRCGVRVDVPVVVYDDAGGISAARAWWLLRHHGHPDVRLLDGGWPAWERLGGPVETGPAPVPAYGDFEPRSGGMPVVDADGAARLAAEGLLVDARAPERYRGETEPVDPVAGHVPGAVNVPAVENLVAVGERSGRFRSVDELAGLYAVPDGAEVGVYCGSGVTAAHDVLALELAGVRAALYAGSWSSWVRDPTRPVETG
jgi:thiosulfate/3-mercaptopyruvate sulfurtransferase